MSERNEARKKSTESTAESGSTMQDANIAADLDHVKMSPMIRHLVENMSDEHWKIVHKALCVPRTKVEVGHLCEGIVVRVVRMARCYLLPAFLEVQGVPTAHVLTCGSNRVNTSEARNAAKPFLGQESQAITSEMLLAAAKEEVDRVILASVRIVSGLETAVPIYLEDPRRADLTPRLNFYPSDPLSESLAENLVDEVFHFMNESGVSDQNIHWASFSIMGRVIEHIKAAFESAVAIGAASLNRVCAASKRLFRAMRRAVGKLSPKCLTSGSKKDVTMADARDLISQVIVAMRHELPEPRSPEDLEQGLLVHRILGALLKEVKRPQSPRQPSPQSPWSGVSQRDGGNDNKLCGAPARPDVSPEGIPLVLVCPSGGLSAVSAGETVTHLVDATFEWEKCAPTTGRREQVISDPKVEQCSHGIACTVQRILRNHPGLQTVQVPAGKSLSDSVLLRLRPRPVDTNKIPFGLVNSYMEEAVKRMVRSSLFPSAANQQPAQGQLEEDFSGELRSTVGELIKLITQEAMLTLSKQLEEDMASQGHIRKLSYEQGQTGSFASPLRLLESSHDYASLVGMLVVQLLKKINSIQAGQGGLPDDVLDMSRELIGRILHQLKKYFGIASDEQYPEGLNCHLILRSVYKGLIKHFGSENALSFALETGTPSFSSSLADILTNEIIKTRHLTSTAESTFHGQLDADSQDTRKKMFFFRLKKPTFNWKKSGASKARATVTPSKTVPELIEAPVAARSLKETQEETTARCWCFRIPKLKFSFKKIMKRGKVGPETQLDDITAEMPPSGSGLAEEETGSGLAYMCSQENIQ